MVKIRMSTTFLNLTQLRHASIFLSIMSSLLKQLIVFALYMLSEQRLLNYFETRTHTHLYYFFLQRQREQLPTVGVEIGLPHP